MLSEFWRRTGKWLRKTWSDRIRQTIPNTSSGDQKARSL